MTPEIPQINTSDKQGAIQQVVAPEPQIAPPPFKSRFEDIIKQYEQMLAKTQQEDAQASKMLKDLVDPDTFKNKYLPKPTARGLLQDALYNFGMSFNSSRTGQRFEPIEQQRMQNALAQYRADVQNKQVDVTDRKNTMQQMLGQMQQYRLAKAQEESAYQAEQRQKLAETTEQRRREAMEASNEYKQAWMREIALPKTASELEMNAARKAKELALTKLMQRAKNPMEMAQLMATDPFWQNPETQGEFMDVYKKLMENSRAGMLSGASANFLRPVGTFNDPNQGLVRVLESKDGSQTVYKPLSGLQPQTQFGANRELDQSTVLAQSAVTAIADAIGSGYISNMVGPTKSAFFLDDLRRMGLYGKYQLIERDIDNFMERMMSGELLRTTGKAVNETELARVKAWQPDKVKDTPENFAKNVLKISLWSQLANRKLQTYTGQMTPAEKAIGFTNLINQYANDIYNRIKKLGPSASDTQREAVLIAYSDMIWDKAQNGSTAVAPPSTPMPAPRPKEQPQKPAANPTPSASGPRVPTWDPATRSFK